MISSLVWDFDSGGLNAVKLTAYYAALILLSSLFKTKTKRNMSLIRRL